MFLKVFCANKVLQKEDIEVGTKKMTKKKFIVCVIFFASLKVG